MMSLTNNQWNDLCDAIQQNECVLLLGPNAATYNGEPLLQLLIKRFARLLQREHGILPTDCPTKLFELVKMYQSKQGDRTTALEKIGKILASFYSEFAPSDIPIYRLLADLPLRYIINTSPDDLAAQALAQKNRVPHSYFYHFFKPEHNTKDNDAAVDLVDAKVIKEEINTRNTANKKIIDTNTPLFYNLTGHYSQPDSLVLTDDDRLQFVEKVLQTDGGGLPPNLAFYFTNKPRFRMRKTYLFIGFDFNEWHLRLLMHLLRRSQEHLPQTFTLQNADDLHNEVRFFYNNSFNMVFAGNESEDFLTELGKQLKKNTPSKKDNTNALQTLLLYHEADTSLCEELDRYLANLRSSGLIETWHEGKILASSDRDQIITEKLQTADIIVPLVTANFMDSDKLYEQDLKIALQRHESGEAKLVPILMTPYDLYDTVFEELNTLLPKKPRGKAVSEEANREAALTDIAKEIRAIIDRIKNPIKPIFS